MPFALSLSKGALRQAQGERLIRDSEKHISKVVN